jgi:hypothetical protein
MPFPIPQEDDMERSTRRRYDRRQVLKLAAAAAGGAVAAPFIAGAAALGRDGATAPGDRIAVGFIGIGRMGQGHLRCFFDYPEAQIVAVCDVDAWRRQNAKESVEKAYASARPDGSYRGCEAYRDLRDLLARRDIDAVLIATGERWHAPAIVLAAEAGKDVYCEKPMTMTIREALAAAEAVRRNGRVSQVGLQQRSTPEFVKACELVRSGRIGRVKMVYVNFPGTCDEVNLPAEPVPEGLDWDLWLGPCPWRPFHSRYHPYGQPRDVVPWHFCPDFGSGNLTSNAVHSFDVVQWGLGADGSGPVEVVPPGIGLVPSLTYRYASGVVLQVEWKLDPAKHDIPRGWDPNEALQNFGALFVGDDGWIHVGRQGFLRSWPAEIAAGPPGEFDRARPVPDHHRNWLAAIRSRGPTACDASVGGGSTIVSHLGVIAHRTGRPLVWDPARNEFIGDDEANRLRSRAMRAPWRV